MFKTFAVFLTVIEFVILALHALIYFVVVFLFSITSVHAQIALAVALGILSVSFLLSTLLSYKISTPVGRAFYLLSASWMVMVYFLTFASVVGIVLYAVLPFSGHAALVVSSVVYALGILGGVYALINERVVRVTRRTITLPSVPAFWNDKVVVFVSDIHLGHIHGVNFSKKLVNLINAQNPQAILIGGDMFDGPAIDAEKATRPFHDLSAPLGSFFITGNHDEFSDPTVFLNAIKKAGIRVLDSESVSLEGINFTGVDYRKTTKPEQFADVLTGLVLPSGPNILLKHVPSNLEQAEKKGFDATMSGHTHNGQMYPLGYLARRSYGYNYGLELLKNMNVLVSSGAGSWGPPGRFGTKSEIVVVSFTERKN